MLSPQIFQWWWWRWCAVSHPLLLLLARCNNNPFVSGICVKITFSLIIISIKHQTSHKFSTNPILPVPRQRVHFRHAMKIIQQHKTIDFKMYFEYNIESKTLYTRTMLKSHRLWWFEFASKENQPQLLMAFVLNKCLKQYIWHFRCFKLCIYAHNFIIPNYCQPQFLLRIFQFTLPDVQNVIIILIELKWFCIWHVCENASYG